MTKQIQALPTQIAQSILQRIISGEFASGTLIPSERNLQEEYDVSRAVVREAIKLLSARKIISSNQGQGAIVTSDFTEPVLDALLLAFHQSQIRTEDVFSARALIEPRIAALAAERATTPQIRYLTDLARKFRGISLTGDPEAVAHGLNEWGKIDQEFHQLLAEASQNAVYGILTSLIVGVVWKSISAKTPTPPADRFVIAASQHAGIAQAIADHDPKSAETLMLDHIETSRRNIISPDDRVQIQPENLI